MQGQPGCLSPMAGLTISGTGHRLTPPHPAPAPHAGPCTSRALAPLLPLAQRLPSVFAFREVRDPVDARYASAYVFNDSGGALFRPLGHRFDGEGGVDVAPVARRLQLEFERVWERSRPCTEYRPL